MATARRQEGQERQSRRGRRRMRRLPPATHTRGEEMVIGFATQFGQGEAV